MTILGKNGSVVLRRTLPDPIVVPSSSLNISNNRFTLNSDLFWPADPVTLIAKNATTIVSISGFIYKDALDRVTLHSTSAGALNNNVATVISLSSLSSNHVILAYTGTSTQTTILINHLTSLLTANTVLASEASLRSWPSIVASYRAAESKTLNWNIQGELRKWSLSTSPKLIDTTALGDEWGSSAPTLLTGSGNFDFLVRCYADTGKQDATDLLRLTLLTERSAAADVKLYIKNSSSEGIEPCGAVTRTNLISTLYYSASIILSQSVIDVSSDAIITGSANFVATGPIRLRSD